VDPAAGGGADAVHGDDAGVGEEAVEEEADDAADGVLGEEIEGVVDADPVLDLRRVVADGAGDDAEEDGGPEGDEAGGGGGGDEAGDRAGAETDGGVFSLETEIELKVRW
jgi:hypothetical protein